MARVDDEVRRIVNDVICGAPRRYVDYDPGIRIRACVMADRDRILIIAWAV